MCHGGGLPDDSLPEIKGVVHRIAIGNERLLDCGNGEVRFRYRGDAHRRVKVMRPPVEEFMCAGGSHLGARCVPFAASKTVIRRFCSTYFLRASSASAIMSLSPIAKQTQPMGRGETHIAPRLNGPGSVAPRAPWNSAVSDSVLSSAMRTSPDK
ncbi:MAG: transposase, partial [Gammaproteobacteria bacterium]